MQHQIISLAELNNLKILSVMKKMKEGSKAEQARDKKAGAKEHKVEAKEYVSRGKNMKVAAKVFGSKKYGK